MGGVSLDPSGSEVARTRVHETSIVSGWSPSVSTVNNIHKHFKKPMIYLFVTSRFHPSFGFSRPFEQGNREMVSSWQLMLGLYVISAHSIPAWDVDTQNTDMISSEWVPDRLALANSDGSSEFAQSPSGSNVVSSEIPIAQGSSRCAFDTKRFPGRMRARDERSCAADLLQLNHGEEKGRQLLPVEPNAQQGGGGQNNDGSGHPDRRVILPSKDDIVQNLFIPEENRPRPNSELCSDPLHPIPVCAKPSGAYLSIYPVPGRLMVNPCYPCTFFFLPRICYHDNNSHHEKTYFFLLFFFVCAMQKVEIDAEDPVLYADVPFVGCLTLEGGRIGYCCLAAPVAYGFVSAFACPNATYGKF